MRLTSTLITLLALASLAGCFGPMTSTSVGSDGVTRTVTTLDTALIPKETLRRSTAVFTRLELRRVKPPGYTSGGGFFANEPTDWPVVGDALSGNARAMTASGDTIDLYATWIGKDQTTVKITTTLKAAQHQRLVEELIAALNPPGAR